MVIDVVCKPKLLPSSIPNHGVIILEDIRSLAINAVKWQRLGVDRAMRGADFDAVVDQVGFEGVAEPFAGPSVGSPKDETGLGLSDKSDENEQKELHIF